MLIKDKKTQYIEKKENKTTIMIYNSQIDCSETTKTIVQFQSQESASLVENEAQRNAHFI